METSESRSATEVTGTSQPSETPAGRLVIRVKIVSEAAPQPTVPRGLNRGALALVLGGVLAALMLSWILTSVFRSDPGSTTTASEESDPVAPQSQAATPTAKEAIPVVSLEQEQSDAPPSPINEVIPHVPQSALQTIRGTVRVTIRVILDKDGAILAATSDVPGPSRYFERLSLEAAKKWTFTPANTEEPRAMLVQFHYTREGATARANLPH